MVTPATESKSLQSAPLCNVADDCLYKVILPCISHPTDVFALSLTCRQLAPLAYSQELWDLFFKSHLPSCPDDLKKGNLAMAFHRYLHTRVDKLETYLCSLELKEINPLLTKLSETKSAFQKLQLINNASDTIFGAICNPIRNYAYSDYSAGAREDRSCASRFMRYFNNQLPLPSPKALASYIDDLERQGPLGAACFYAYYKQNQTPLLCEAIREHQLKNMTYSNNTTIHKRLTMITYTCILRYSKNATLSELFSQSFDPNCDPESPYLISFIKYALKPVENLPDHLALICPPNTCFPIRTFCIPALWEYQLLLESGNPSNVIAYIGEDACLDLGVNGEINLYGLGSDSDQLLIDFETLCSLPGIDLHVKDAEGKTPLEIAEALGMKDAAEILKAAIAKQNTQETSPQ